MRTNFPRQFLSGIISVFFLTLLSPGLKSYAQTIDSTIFRDDFDRDFFGSAWDAHPSWSIVNGSAYNFIDGTGGTLKTTESYLQTSYIIETSAKGFNDNYYREFRLTFGQADPLAEATYELKYTAYGGGKLTLGKSLDNIYAAETLDEAAVFPEFNSSQWYTFKIAKYTSGLIQVYVDKGSGYDSLPILEAIDLTYPALGHVGWQVDTETFAEDFYVDWISAIIPDKEKPAVKEKPAEDNLITQVSIKSGKHYTVAKLAPGVKQLIDRDYIVTSVPQYLNGASFIQTANNDKLNTDDSALTFFVKKSAILYVGYDPRKIATPEWLGSWNKTPDSIKTSDQKVGYLEVYSKLAEYGQVYPFPIVLGSNRAAPARGALTNYLVAAIERPDSKQYQAEDASLSGAVAASDHLNYDGTGFADFKNLFDDYVEFTVQIDVPGTYHLGFKFANAGTEDRVLQITDNGTDAGTLAFIPISSSWDTWAFVSGPQIFMTAGVHKIRLTATGTSGPNIDELSLFYLSDAPPLPPLPVALARNAGVRRENNRLFYQSDKAFPNPFSQSTKIFYDLQEKAKVNLSVYTLQGQQLQILENAEHEAGHYQATFNAGNVAKGMYFYRLQIGNNISVGKLIKE